MKSLIIGRGEIGTAVHEVIRATDTVYTYDLEGRNTRVPVGIDVMHICIPYNGRFIKAVKDYMTHWEPAHVIIWSTVEIGTTQQIAKVVHSPVEGVHPALATSIRIMPRWIGYNDKEEANFFCEYFLAMGLKVRRVPNTDFTEFLKLRSTAKYGINLVWTDYEKSVSDSIGMDFGLLKDFDQDYNNLYRDLNMDWAKRYILDPPGDKIGGHCIVPNAHLLDKQYPSELLKMIKGKE